MLMGDHSHDNHSSSGSSNTELTQLTPDGREVNLGGEELFTIRVYPGPSEIVVLRPPISSPRRDETRLPVIDTDQHG